MKHALAIFAKTPLPGKVKTRLSPPLTLRQCADLYRCMLLDTVERTAALGVDTVLFYEGGEGFFEKVAPGAVLVHQSPGGLGVRLEHAFDEMARLGYASRVVIGSDSPDLPLRFIEEAFRVLERGEDAVFGPAEDGGYYLVGVKGAYGALFEGIPWSGDKVLEASLRQAKNSGLSAALLPPWHDIDSYGDLLLLDHASGAARTGAFIAALGLAPSLAADAG